MKKFNAFLNTAATFLDQASKDIRGQDQEAYRRLQDLKRKIREERKADYVGQIKLI